MTLPIEMSISPEITSRVSATAITPSTLITLAAVSRFCSVRKNGELTQMRTKTTTRTRISPSPCNCSTKRRRRASRRSASFARFSSSRSRASSPSRLVGAGPPLPGTPCSSWLPICHLPRSAGTARDLCCLGSRGWVRAAARTQPGAFPYLQCRNAVLAVTS